HKRRSFARLAIVTGALLVCTTVSTAAAHAVTSVTWQQGIVNSGSSWVWSGTYLSNTAFSEATGSFPIPALTNSIDYVITYGDGRAYQIRSSFQAVAWGCGWTGGSGSQAYLWCVRSSP